MNPELARLIREISSPEDVSKIEEAVTLLKTPTTAAAADDPADDDMLSNSPDFVAPVATKSVSVSLNTIARLLYDLNASVRTIEWLRSYCDKDLDKFILNIQRSLVDYATCKEAASTYTIEWFAELPFSDDGMKKIAAMLISTTEPFIKDGINPVWNEIMAGNISTFNRLSDLVKESDSLSDDD